VRSRIGKPRVNNGLKGREIGGIINENDDIGPSEVDGKNGEIAFLTCCIPYFKDDGSDGLIRRKKSMSMTIIGDSNRGIRI